MSINLANMSARAVCTFLLTWICVSTLAADVLSLDVPDEQKPTAVPEVETKNVTAHYCPFPCTVGNQTLCYPPPCPPPACVDPAKYKPTDCCEYCPNGPDCSAPDGKIVKWQHWRMIDGKNCTCVYLGQPTTCV